MDFETANGFRGSACSVGLIKVRSGKIVERDYWVMRPPAGFDHFEARNVQIHGIRPQDVEGAPRFGDTYPRLQAFVGNDILVAHNAAFDVGVILAGMQASGVSSGPIDYACTVKVARRTYELASYSLPFAAAAAGYELTSHHDALADAEACAHIAMDAAQRHGASSIPDLLGAVGLGLGHQEGLGLDAPECKELRDARGWRSAGHTLPRQLGSPWPTEGANPAPNTEADQHHPLFGEVVVFTGDLGLPRPEAKVRAAERGARTADRVTRATSVLVVGDGFVPEDLAAGRLTSKAKHALRLQQAGQRVEIVSESQFLQMVGGNWPAGL